MARLIRSNMDISKKIYFVKFCYISATLLQKDLGLPTEKLVCLYNECIHLAKHFDGMTRIIPFVRFCYASATVLQQNLRLPTENLICLFKECIELAKHCNDKDIMIVSCMEFVLNSNSVGRQQDSLGCLKEILPLVQEIPGHVLLIYEYLSMTHEQLQNFERVLFNSKQWIDIACKIGNKNSEMYGNLSMVRGLLSLTRYDEAIDYAEKSIAIAEKTGSETGVVLAYGCIMRAHMCMERFEDVIISAQNVLNYSLKGKDQKALFNVYVQLGKAHLELYQYQDAADCGKKCIDIAKQIEDGRHCEVWGYLFLGKTYFASSDLDSAISYCKQCIELAVVIGEKYAEADAYNLLGSIYHDLEKYDDAISCCNKCVKIDRNGTEAKAADATAYLTLGQASKCLKKYDDAIQNFKQCIYTLDAIAQRKETKLVAYLGLGDVLQTLERYTDAVDNIKQCISIAQEINDKKTQIAAYSLLSQVYTHSMQLHDLSQSIQAGMAIAVELGDKDAESNFKVSLSRLHTIVGLDDKTTSSDVLSTNQSLDLTCPENELMEDLAQAMDTGDKSKKYMALFNLYKFYISKKDYKNAIYCIEQLREMEVDHTMNFFYCTEIGHMYQTMDQYDTALLYYEEGVPLVQLCANNRHRFKFYYGFGQLLVSLEKELNLAKYYLKEAIRCFEAIFTTLGSCDKFKISIFDEYVHCYKLLALLFIDDKQILEALLVLDRCRARALKDLMIANFKMKEEDSCEAEYPEYRDPLLLASTNDFSIAFYSLIFDALFKFLFREDGSLRFSMHPNEITIDDINRKYIDKLIDEIGVRERVNCEDRCLDEVDIPKEHKRSKEEYLGLRKPSTSLLNLDPTRGDSNENDGETKGSTLESLFRILECDAILLSKQDEVVFIPEGPLYQVPFPALRDPSTGKYLSETKRIRLAPSLVTLKHFEDFQTNQTSDAKPLIIGSPLVGTVMMGGKQRDIEPLFGALDEALDIAALLGVRALVAAKATKPVVLEKLREGVSVVHIAAHGSLSQAAIVLAPSPEIKEIKVIPDEEDYMLTMADVQQAQVRAQLVVLSCCHSGRGEIRAEGVVGMCRAFLASGARAVVASLWAIDDQATLAFMRIFYGHLKHGESASMSLQLTMNDMRGTSDYKDVKKWAPFFLMGDDVTLKL